MINDVNELEVENALNDKELNKNKQIIKELTNDLESMNDGLKEYQEWIKNKSPKTKEKFASRREVQLRTFEQNVENEERLLNERLDNVNEKANSLKEHF